MCFIKVSLQVSRSWAIRFSVSYPVAPHSVITSSRKPLRGLPLFFFPWIRPSMTLSIKPSSCRIMCPSHFFCLSLIVWISTRSSWARWVSITLVIWLSFLCILFFDRYPGYVFISDTNISQSADVSLRLSEESLMGIIVDLHLLARSDFLVCTCSSNVCISSFSLIFSSMLFIIVIYLFYSFFQ